MIYTTSKQADRKIEEDIKIICEELKKKIPGLLSIILTGGFSRGEGPVKKIGKKYYPYNDYDIQAISTKKLDKNLVDKIATEISRKIGYRGIKAVFYPFKKEGQILEQNFYIDLKCFTPNELKKLLPRIRYYELKNDSKLLYGKDLRCLIPYCDLKEVPLSEGAKLLLDRMSQMIEYYSTEKKHDKEFLTYIIQQAYAACCTSLLLLSRKYQIGYKKSGEIFKKTYKSDFPELYQNIPNLADKIEQFIKWKLDPEKMPGKNIENEWFQAKDNLFEVSKYFFSKFLGKKIRNLNDLSNEISDMRSKFYSSYLRSMIKNKIKIDSKRITYLLLPLASLVLKRGYYMRLKEVGLNKPGVLFGKSPELRIFSSLIFISNSISRKGIDEAMLRKGQKLLRKVYPSAGRTWEEISIDYANAYIAFSMQKI